MHHRCKNRGIVPRKIRKENKNMKKKFMAVLLAGAMVLAAGCGSAGKVTVGEYKGLALTSVSQATVDADIAEMLEYYSELVEVDRAAQEGDTVNINYVGLKDGAAFDGGTDDSEAGTDLVLGSGSFIDGFEDGLVGAVAGEKRDLNLTFPEGYPNADLAGQAVVFQVTVNAVKEIKIPELTDEFIAEKFPTYTTAEEYKEARREYLNTETYYEQATKQIMASSEVEKYNEDEVEKEKQALIDEYTAYASYYGSRYGLDTETSIRYVLGFQSKEAFEEEMGKFAYEVVKNAMIIKEIAKIENIELTDEIYNSMAEEYAAAYEYDDVEDFVKALGEDMVREAFLTKIVMDFVIENAVITEAQ